VTLATYKTRFVLHRQNHFSVLRIKPLELCREIIAVYCEILKKQVNTLCGENVEFLGLKKVVLIDTADLLTFSGM